MTLNGREVDAAEIDYDQAEQLYLAAVRRKEPHGVLADFAEEAERRARVWVDHLREYVKRGRAETPAGPKQLPLLPRSGSDYSERGGKRCASASSSRYVGTAAQSKKLPHVASQEGATGSYPVQTTGLRRCGALHRLGNLLPEEPVGSLVVGPAAPGAAEGEVQAVQLALNFGGVPVFEEGIHV